jgi:hypothetical protein
MWERDARRKAGSEGKNGKCAQRGHKPHVTKPRLGSSHVRREQSLEIIDDLRMLPPPQSLLLSSVSRSVSMPAMCFHASSLVIARVAPDLNAVVS